MRTAKVIALTVSGIRKVFRAGDEVKETNFPPDHFDTLIQRGFLKENIIEPEKENVTDELIFLKEPEAISKINFGEKKNKKK